MHIIKEYERQRDVLSKLVECELTKNPKCINAEELGEVVDMIKDYEEAIYYHSISHAMKENEEEKMHEKQYGHQRYYEPMYYPRKMYPIYPLYDEYRDMDREKGRMYYHDGRGGQVDSMPRSDGSMSESATNYPNYAQEMRDHREGRSPMSRRGYMESKEMRHDKTKQMNELNKYLQELCDDVVEMLEDATPEEKVIVSQKLSTLASKIK